MENFNIWSKQRMEEKYNAGLIHVDHRSAKKWTTRVLFAKILTNTIYANYEALRNIAEPAILGHC